MVKPALNRDRRDYLAAVDRRLVYRHSSGYDMRKRRVNCDLRADRLTREAVAAGWIVRGPDGFYTLTDTGRADLAAVTSTPPPSPTERTP